MTSPESRGNRAQPVHLELRRADAGTLLGSIAWVMGALQIMRDRAHAEGEHGGTEYDMLYQKLQPRLERIVDQIAKSREASMTRPEFEEGVETAYQDIREAFEKWIQLTAIDTLGAAVASHLGEDDELEFDDEDDEDDGD
jgi:hypothetical protein